MSHSPQATAYQTASPSLTGFLYQFQGSILEVMKLRGGKLAKESWVTFEGLQDLDVESGGSVRLVQFKYLPSKTLCASTVRWPVLEMLSQSASGGVGESSYELVIYVSRDGGLKLESVSDLKKLGLFSYQSKSRDYVRDNDLSERDLVQFLKSFRLRVGPSLELSYEQVIEAICKLYRCQIPDAEEYYYPRAIEKCLDLSTRPGLEDRRVSVSDFIKQLKGPRRPVVLQKRLVVERITGVGMEMAIAMLRARLSEL